MENLNANLKIAREQLGLSQMQTANILGMSQSCYVKYELGQEGKEADLILAIKKLDDFHKMPDLAKSIYALGAAEYWLCKYLIADQLSSSLMETISKYPLRGLGMLTQKINHAAKDQETERKISELMSMIDVDLLSENAIINVEVQGIWETGWSSSSSSDLSTN